MPLFAFLLTVKNLLAYMEGEVFSLYLFSYVQMDGLQILLLSSKRISICHENWSLLNKKYIKKEIQKTVL